MSSLPTAVLQEIDALVSVVAATARQEDIDEVLETVRSRTTMILQEADAFLIKAYGKENETVST